MAKRLRIVSFKTTDEQFRTLEQCASAYRAANVSHFLREMVRAMSSGDQNELSEFNARLLSGFGRMVGQQLTIDAVRATEAALSIKPSPRKLPRVRKVKRARP